MSWGHLFLDIFDDVEFSIDMEYAPNNSLKYSSEKQTRFPLIIQGMKAQDLIKQLPYSFSRLIENGKKARVQNLSFLHLRVWN